MDIAVARRGAARIASALRRARNGPAMREPALGLSAALRARPRRPAVVRELCHALCAEMSVRRGGRPVELRFVAEAQQQLVIVGHELWHLHTGHRHHHTAAANAPARRPGWGDKALAVVARGGSREADEAAADDFGHRPAAVLRPYPSGGRESTAPDPVQRTPGYRGRWGMAR